jgi:hypothetical protein
MKNTGKLIATVAIGVGALFAMPAAVAGASTDTTYCTTYGNGQTLCQWDGGPNDDLHSLTTCDSDGSCTTQHYGPGF